MNDPTPERTVTINGEDVPTITSQDRETGMARVETSEPVRRINTANFGNLFPQATNNRGTINATVPARTRNSNAGDHSAAIGTEELCAYLVAEWGAWLVVSPDGRISITLGEIDQAPSERPVAMAQCPGIGQQDMSYWREGWDCDGLSDREVIEECCRVGDVSDEIGALVGILNASHTH